jgi:choline dehydrogenase
MQLQSVTICIQLLLILTLQTEAQQLLGNFLGIAGSNATFDYVIVGGGTAGQVVANRLAESGRYQVAVIEGGGFCQVGNGNTSEVPATVLNMEHSIRPQLTRLPLLTGASLPRLSLD